MPFPLPFIPKADYKGQHKGKRYFGAPRAGGRLHAGCDLIAPLRTSVFAVGDGVVYEISREFYNGTAAIAIEHDNLAGGPGRVVRYCEILNQKKDPDVFGRLRVGDRVSAGQTIAFVGKMLVDSMLHFELYSGQGIGKLSVSSGPLAKAAYKRRIDLMDPTSLLDQLAKDVQPTMEFTLAETQAR